MRIKTVHGEQVFKDENECKEYLEFIFGKGKVKLDKDGNISNLKNGKWNIAGSYRK